MDPLLLQDARIAVDAMGGDHAPDAAIRGAARALAEADGFRCILVGDERKISSVLSRCEHPASRVEIAHTDEAIGMDEPAREAILKKPRASVLVGAEMLGHDGADALVSAGSTGALVLGAARHLPMIPGTSRSGLAALIPTRRRNPEDRGFVLLIDVGATLRVSAQQLSHFATMGAAYLRAALGVPSPRVGLLNIGEEATKGDETLRAAYGIISKMNDIRFAGNVEGKDVPAGNVDVVVCDGFTGNVVLKMYEGVASVAMDLAREAGRDNLLWSVGLRLLRPAIDKLRRKTDFAEYGGAPILGFERLVVKAHGRSNARAVRSAILVAREALKNDLLQRITSDVTKINETFFAQAAGL
ncbi:MAG: phosphate acyltransferase PlsX [Myxococcota bacterium]